MADAAQRLTTLAEELLSTPLPVRVRAWDGSEAGPPGAPVLVIRSRRALRRLLWKPGELGLARAWVAGEIDFEGDLYEALELLAELIWEREDAGRNTVHPVRDPRKRAAARGLLRLGGPLPPPPPPPEELRRHTGRPHTRRRDKEAISHHYDVGNDFYALVLGPSMVYSCAYFSDPTAPLEDAQHDKLDLIARKLALRPGLRLLDVGCGWGSLALHAARAHGVQVTGITLSTEQAAFARERVAEAGLADRVEIRVQDYRDVLPQALGSARAGDAPFGPYDAISSVGMAEHVGAVQYAEYAADLYALLKPGGRLLNHQIARRPVPDEETYRVDPFIDSYVFPDGELAPLGRTVGQLEQAGFEVRDVESIREHYALTLRHWVANLEKNWDAALRTVTPGRARIWRLYMAASALSFEHNTLGVNQVLAVRPGPSGASGMPLRTRAWNARDQ
ncbi:class I SAM-dependent methyltransferase [Streptomyces sp. CA-294286]|uniref:class I SAM-dependent methyltransferase n=1 Tax=Streptomyces sp. CA-294286 TaxID=3240070 RepID=UPI003D8E8FF0